MDLNRTHHRIVPIGAPGRSYGHAITKTEPHLASSNLTPYPTISNVISLDDQSSSWSPSFGDLQDIEAGFPTNEDVLETLNSLNQEANNQVHGDRSTLTISSSPLVTVTPVSMADRTLLPNVSGTIGNTHPLLQNILAQDGSQQLMDPNSNPMMSSGKTSSTVRPLVNIASKPLERPAWTNTGASWTPSFPSKQCVGVQNVVISSQKPATPPPQPNQIVLSMADFQKIQMASSSKKVSRNKTNGSNQIPGVGSFIQIPNSTGVFRIDRVIQIPAGGAPPPHPGVVPTAHPIGQTIYPAVTTLQMGTTRPNIVVATPRIPQPIVANAPTISRVPNLSQATVSSPATPSVQIRTNLNDQANNVMNSIQAVLLGKTTNTNQQPTSIQNTRSVEMISKPVTAAQAQSNPTITQSFATSRPDHLYAEGPSKNKKRKESNSGESSSSPKPVASEDKPIWATLLTSGINLLKKDLDAEETFLLKLAHSMKTRTMNIVFEETKREIDTFRKSMVSLSSLHESFRKIENSVNALADDAKVVRSKIMGKSGDDFCEQEDMNVDEGHESDSTLSATSPFKYPSVNGSTIEYPEAPVNGELLGAAYIKSVSADGKVAYRCKSRGCGKIYPNLASVKKHIRKRHKTKSLISRQESPQTTALDSASRSAALGLRNQVMDCHYPTCDKSFVIPSKEYDAHKREHELSSSAISSTTSKCCHCGLELPTVEELSSHENNCSVFVSCGFNGCQVRGTKADIDEHRLHHAKATLPIKPSAAVLMFKCDKCTSKFRDRITLISHKAKVHPTSAPAIKPKKKHSSPETLTVTKSTACTFCSRLFSNEADLKKHNQTDHAKLSSLTLNLSQMAAPEKIQDVLEATGSFRTSPEEVVTSGVKEQSSPGKVATESSQAFHFMTCEICYKTKMTDKTTTHFGTVSCNRCYEVARMYVKAPTKIICFNNMECFKTPDEDIEQAVEGRANKVCKACIINACFDKFHLDAEPRWTEARKLFKQSYKVVANMDKEAASKLTDPQRKQLSMEISIPLPLLPQRLLIRARELLDRRKLALEQKVVNTPKKVTNERTATSSSSKKRKS